MQDRIIGTTMPVLEITLEDGESVRSEDGEFSWMSDAVELGVDAGGGVGGTGAVGGLVSKAIKRVAGGGTFLFNTYTARGGTGIVAFAARLPGHIFPVDIGPGEEYMAHRHGFMAGTTGVEISMALQQSFSGGIFGGEGFVLQHLSGEGRAFINLSGEVVTFDLVAGQSMRVHPGHVGLFQRSVTFSVVRVPGITNRYLGGDGHHFAVLTGPGKIWLQSMPVAMLAGALEPYLDQGRRDGGVAKGAAAGAVLGDILGKR